MVWDGGVAEVGSEGDVWAVVERWLEGRGVRERGESGSWWVQGRAWV